MRKLGRIVRWTALSGLILLALVVATGITYQRIETMADARRYPEPGRLVSIGDHRLQLNCMGTGRFTVVLEGGLGDISVEWKQVQSQIAACTRVWSYDRAGYGGSDAGPMPRTSSQIAAELHALLQAAGEKPPFVLVGHSFGGYNVRVFAGQHSTEVAGMVLVDSTQEDEYRLLPPVWKRVGGGLLARYRSQARWAPLLIGLGVTRARLGAQAHEPFFYLYMSPKYLKSRASELEMIQTSAEQARAAGTLGDMPLIVLTAAQQVDAFLKSGLTDSDFQQYKTAWVGDIQPRLVQLSTRGQQIVISSGHNMPAERPDAIVAAVREICAEQAGHFPK